MVRRVAPNVPVLMRTRYLAEREGLDLSLCSAYSDSANDLLGLALDPNVHIQESKVATCDVRPGPRPTGPALLAYVEDYRRRAGISAGGGCS